MGALEFAPATGPKARDSQKVSVDALVELASEVLSQRNDLKQSFADEHTAESLRDILRVGTSAGGARAKAIIAWNSTLGPGCGRLRLRLLDPQVRRRQRQQGQGT